MLFFFLVGLVTGHVPAREIKKWWVAEITNMLPSSVGLFLSLTVRSVPRRPSPASAAEWPSQQSYLPTASLLFELDDWVAGSSTQCLLHLMRTTAVDTSAQFTQFQIERTSFYGRFAKTWAGVAAQPNQWRGWSTDEHRVSPFSVFGWLIDMQMQAFP